MGEAFALGDRVGVLEEGQLIAYDRPAVVANSTEPLVRQLLDALPRVPQSASLASLDEHGMQAGERVE